MSEIMDKAMDNKLVLEEDELEEGEDEISTETSVLATAWHMRMCALNADSKYDVPIIENLEYLMERDQTAFKDLKTQEVHFADMLKWSIAVSSVKEDSFYTCSKNKDYIPEEEQFYDESSGCFCVAVNVCDCDSDDVY